MVLNPNKHEDGFPSGSVCSVNVRKDVGYPQGCRQYGEPFLYPKIMTLREKRLKFHIENNDYFGTLATVLDLIRQSKNNKTLKNIRDDLVYLQKNYSINKNKD